MNLFAARERIRLLDADKLSFEKYISFQNDLQRKFIYAPSMLDRKEFLIDIEAADTVFLHALKNSI